MGYKPFQRPAPNGESEFAATILSVPAGDSDLPATAAGDAAAAAPLDTASLPPAEGAEALRMAAAPTLSHIGRYAVKHRLGQGGLGTVYEAWDPLLSRTVAVKTLQFAVDTATRGSLDALFLNEARLAAGLNHPYIVTIFDAGLSAQGVYIAMERLRGRDLREALQDGWRPDATTSALLVRRVADALAYAHARGVVHCDIKPANIYIARRDKPKVLDFGIARAAHGSARAALSVLDGAIVGSPHYLAPEQLEGSLIDARTDVYSLGVVLYELLTGQKAFDGANLSDIAAAVMAGDATPAHVAQPGVPPELSAVAARAMARKPADRYANAQDMAQDLRRWLEGPALVTPAVAPPAPPARSSNRAAWVAGGATLLAAAVFWAAWPQRQTAAPASPPLPAPVASAPAPAPAEAAAASAAASAALAATAASAPAAVPAEDTASAAPARAPAPARPSPRARAPPRNRPVPPRRPPCPRRRPPARCSSPSRPGARSRSTAARPAPRRRCRS
ncbi:MAG: serine/threonine-protein kinase [Rubrivivax sp.]